MYYFACSPAYVLITSMFPWMLFPAYVEWHCTIVLICFVIMIPCLPYNMALVVLHMCVFIKLILFWCVWAWLVARDYVNVSWGTADTGGGSRELGLNVVYYALVECIWDCYFFALSPAMADNYQYTLYPSNMYPDARMLLMEMLLYYPLLLSCTVSTLNGVMFVNFLLFQLFLKLS